MRISISILIENRYHIDCTSEPSIGIIDKPVGQRKISSQHRDYQIYDAQVQQEDFP